MQVGWLRQRPFRAPHFRPIPTNDNKSMRIRMHTPHAHTTHAPSHRRDRRAPSHTVALCAAWVQVDSAFRDVVGLSIAAEHGFHYKLGSFPGVRRIGGGVWQQLAAHAVLVVMMLKNVDTFACFVCPVIGTNGTVR